MSGAGIYGVLARSVSTISNPLGDLSPRFAEVPCFAVPFGGVRRVGPGSPPARRGRGTTIHQNSPRKCTKPMKKWGEICSQPGSQPAGQPASQRTVPWPAALCHGQRRFAMAGGAFPWPAALCYGQHRFAMASAALPWPAPLCPWPEPYPLVVSARPILHSLRHLAFASPTTGQRRSDGQKGI